MPFYLKRWSILLNDIVNTGGTRFFEANDISLNLSMYLLLLATGGKKLTGTRPSSNF